MENISTNRYVIRLLEEWRMHGKIIIAVDFDDTIKHWRFNSQAECDKTIGILKLAKEVGAYIVVFTACSEDRYSEIENHCKENGLNIDGINETPIPLPYGNKNKIYANIFIDDRAGMEEALATLEFAAYSIRSERHPVTEQNVEF